MNRNGGRGSNLIRCLKTGAIFEAENLRPRGRGLIAHVRLRFDDRNFGEPGFGNWEVRDFAPGDFRFVPISRRPR